MVAFDSTVPIADPVVVEVLNFLKDPWLTYVNTFSSTPVTVLRAIILDALAEAAREDERVAVAFSASARNVLPFMETGNELSIWIDVVNEIEATVDSRAKQEWATPSTIQIGPLQIDDIPPTKVSNSAGVQCQSDCLDFLSISRAIRMHSASTTMSQQGARTL